MANNYDAVLTEQFFMDHEGKSIDDIVQILLNDYEFEGYSSNIRKAVAARMIDRPKMKIINKHVPPQMSEEEMSLWYKLSKKYYESENYAQSRVVIEPPDPNLFLGIAVIGDLHFGAIDLQIERLMRETKMLEEADVVINVVDATNLERNLYLTLELLEQHIP
jgi:hypothetical protein